MGVERLFKSFLARNRRVNSHGVCFLRASPDYPSVSASPLQQPEPALPLPSSHYNCLPLPPDCTSLDKAKRPAQLSRLHLVLAKAARLVAGWRERRRM